jgi:HSP20 family protein
MFVLPLSRSMSHRALVPGLSRSLDRLLDESRERQFGVGRDDSMARTPPMDVTESDTHYTIVLDIPGVTREHLKVSVEGRRVSVETVTATAAEPAATDGPPTVTAETSSSARVLYRERSAPHYARTVSLPAEVDQATSQAKLDNGVLTLTLAKKVAAGATQLKVS